MDLVMADAIAIAHEVYKLAVDLWRMQKLRTADLPKAIPTYNNFVRYSRHDCPQPLTSKGSELLIDTVII